MPKKRNKTRADGRIAVQVYLGMVDGKRKYKTVYGATQKEADEKAMELRVRMNKGIDVRRENDAFSAWSALWLTAKKATVGASQQENYSRVVRRLDDAFGPRGIATITLADLQQLINDLAARNPNTGKPASKRLLKLTKDTAVQIFRFAVDNRVIDYNPAASVTIPRDAPAQRRRALTETEISRITEFAHPMQIAAMIMTYAGLRKGELIPLTWSDVDLGAGTITVNKAVEYIGDAPRLKPPKTESGVRTVYIPDVLIRFLSAAPRIALLVFPNPQGAMWKQRQFKRAWNSYLLDMDIVYGNVADRKSKFDPKHKGVEGIERFTPHMCRHTFCSLMYAAGVDVVTAKEQMGHADIKTTLEIYTHLQEGHARAEMQKLNPRPKDQPSPLSTGAN